MDVIAAHRLLAVYPDSGASLVHLRIGRPHSHPLGDWVCPVQTEGLRFWEGPKEFFGIDSWHALMIGLRFLRCILAAEMEDNGAVFHWEDGEQTISIDQLFVLGELNALG